jgi:hypothetical protein
MKKKKKKRTRKATRTIMTKKKIPPRKEEHPATDINLDYQKRQQPNPGVTKPQPHEKPAKGANPPRQRYPRNIWHRNTPHTARLVNQHRHTTHTSPPPKKQGRNNTKGHHNQCPQTHPHEPPYRHQHHREGKQGPTTTTHPKIPEPEQIPATLNP